MTVAPPTGPTLTLTVRNFAAQDPADGWQGLVDLARAADEAGVDRIMVVDHVVMGDQIDAYDGGAFPTGPDGSWLEPMTVLGVLAGSTRQIRLSTGVLVAALRRPPVLAKAAATLDVLSGGRLDLGVGVGWQREEYAAAGLDFERRGALLDETLGICQALWRDHPADLTPFGLDAPRVWCRPTPVQPGGVPIWVGGRLHKRNLRRIVAFADGWIPWGDHIADVVPGIALLHEALREAGRDPSRFGVRDRLVVKVGDDGSPRLAEALAPVAGQVAAGVTDFNLAMPLPDEPDAAGEVLAQVVAAFRAEVGRA